MTDQQSPAATQTDAITPERDLEDQLIANAEAFLDAMGSSVGPVKRSLDFKQRSRARMLADSTDDIESLAFEVIWLRNKFANLLAALKEIAAEDGFDNSAKCIARDAIAKATQP